MYPDFIGIGAQKGGTTWLYRALESHPRIFMPPLKEIHYFDVQRPEARTTSPVPNIDAGEAYGRLKYLHFLNRVKYGGLEMMKGKYSLETLHWDIRYFMGRRSDEWYASLFNGKKEGQIAGEITPAYALLQEEHISHVHRLTPAAKIIYIIRNPVERAWSSAVTTVPKNKTVAQMPFSHFEWALNRPQARARDDFIGTIDRWTKYYGSENFFLGTLDQIEATPEKFMQRLYDFLGVPHSEAQIASIGRVKTGKRSGKDHFIPENVERYLYRMNYDQIKELARRYGSLAALWLDKAERYRA